MNIALIGMAAAGKSYIGKRLAEKFQYRFVDIDDRLEEVHGKPIQRLLDEIGEDAYLDEEARVLIEAAQGDSLVISPGGSVIYRKSGMDHLRKVARTIYLKVPVQTVEERLKGRPPRAIIGLDKKTVRELFNERQPLYEQYADLILEPEKLSSDDVVSAVEQFLHVDNRGGSV